MLLGRLPGRIRDFRRTFHLNNLGPKPHASRRITNTDPIRHRWLGGRSLARTTPSKTCAHARRPWRPTCTTPGLAKDGAVVGYDTRFISDRFAAAVAKVLSDSGIPTHLFDRPGPTPAGSLAITMLNAGAGAIITASHNPAEMERIQSQVERRWQRAARHGGGDRTTPRTDTVRWAGTGTHIQRAGRLLNSILWNPTPSVWENSSMPMRYGPQVSKLWWTPCTAQAQACCPPCSPEVRPKWSKSGLIPTLPSPAWGSRNPSRPTCRSLPTRYVNWAPTSVLRSMGTRTASEWSTRMASTCPHWMSSR